jgi:hypothetical protein
MHGRHDIGLLIELEANVAEEGLVEDGVDALTLVRAAVPALREPGAFRRLDQMPDCQVLGMPALPRASSIARHAARASGCARRLRAMEFRKWHMSVAFG